MLISLVLNMIETSFKNWHTQDNILYTIVTLFYIRGRRGTANIAKILQQQKFPSLQYMEGVNIYVGTKEKGSFE